MIIITDQINSLSAALLVIAGKGKFIVTKDGEVLDEEGDVIGDAHRISRGWAVHTAPFAGTVPEEQIIFKDEADYAATVNKPIFPEEV